MRPVGIVLSTNGHGENLWSRGNMPGRFSGAKRRRPLPPCLDLVRSGLL